MLKTEFKYGDRLSSEFNIICEFETHSILPELRQYTQEIPGLDGVVDFQIGGYGVRIISVPLIYKGTYKQLRADQEKIIAWLAGNGKPKKLIFGHTPDRYYLAKIISELNFENTPSRRIGTIEFVCNPPWQYLLDGTQMTPEQITFVNCLIENGTFIKEFTENGSIRFYNNGTATVKPVIKVIGKINSGIKLTYGNSSFELNENLGYDGLIIDCENETVKRMSDNSNLYPLIDEVNNIFFRIASGQCEIGVEMPDIGKYPNNITVIVQFNAQIGG